MGLTPGRIRALYGGRHLRITLVLATTSVAAGTLTGLVGIGVAGAPASQHPPATGHHVTPVKPRHHASTPASTFSNARPTRTRSASPSPTATRTHATTSPTPAASSTPTSAPTTTAPSSPASQPASASPPG